MPRYAPLYPAGNGEKGFVEIAIYPLIPGETESAIIRIGVSLQIQIIYNYINKMNLNSHIDNIHGSCSFINTPVHFESFSIVFQIVLNLIYRLGIKKLFCRDCQRTFSYTLYLNC